MYKFRPLRQFIASVTALTLVLGLVPPTALAQGPTKATPAAEKTKPAEAKPTEAKPKAEEPTKPEGAAKPADPAKAGEAATTATAQPAGGEEPAAAEGPSDSQREAARSAFEAGMKAFEAGEYLTAAGEFKKAHEAIPSPHAEYWVATSLDKADPEQKNLHATAEAYELFVTNPAAKHVGQTQLDEAVARLKEIRLLLPGELVVITTPAGATVKLNGETLPGVTPLTVQRPAGKYSLEASSDGYVPLAIEVTLEGGITLEQQMKLAVLPPPPPAAATTPAKEQKEPSMVPAYVTLGLAGATLITGTVFGILALDAKSKYDENPTNDGADDVERNALIADMSLGVAITLGITGVVLLTARESSTSTAKQADRARVAGGRKPTGAAAGRLVVSPYGGPTGGGGFARLTF